MRKFGDLVNLAKKHTCTHLILFTGAGVFNVRYCWIIIKMEKFNGTIFLSFWKSPNLQTLCVSVTKRPSVIDTSWIER